MPHSSGASAPRPRAPQVYRIAKTDKLSALPNVILTPHIAGGSRKGVLSEIGVVLDNCRAALAGKPIQYQVMPS